MSSLMAALLAQIAIITYRGIGKPGLFGTQATGGLFGAQVSPPPGVSASSPPLPVPSSYLAAVAIYGGLSLIGDTGSTGGQIASLVGWGLVVSNLLRLWTLPGSDPQSQPTSQAAANPTTRSA